MSTPQWKGILVHHTAGSADQTVDSIRRYHIEEKGWADIGYHWLVAQDESEYIIVQGRDEHLQGAHSPGRNDIDLGVALIGNFTVFPPSLHQLKTAAELCADLCRRHSIPHTTIRPHRQFRATECPGAAFTDAHIYVLREEVKRLLKQPS